MPQRLLRRLGPDPAGPRRYALRLLVAAAGAAVTTWALSDRDAMRVLAADARTPAGVSRDVHLADGSLLKLNTASAADWRYRPDRREVWLREGEVMVQTADDARPFVLHARAGSVTGTSARFIARDLDAGQSLRVAVIEGSVALRGREGGLRTLQAGEEALMQRDGSYRVQALQPVTTAWLRGVLLAKQLPLGEFLAELSRYRSGLVQCEPRVAGLRVNGEFATDDTGKVLDELGSTLTISVSYITPFWVRVGALQAL